MGSGRTDRGGLTGSEGGQEGVFFHVTELYLSERKVDPEMESGVKEVRRLW